LVISAELYTLLFTFLYIRREEKYSGGNGNLDIAGEGGSDPSSKMNIINDKI
jgi:hypothetical protein